MIVSIIIGRKGSKGFPGKNMYMIEGKPLCSYPMSEAKKVSAIDEHFVSTDDENIKMVAKNIGFDIIDRPLKLCDDKALGEDAYIHAYTQICATHGKPDIVVLLMCNAPMITAETISNGIDILKNDQKIDSAVTVSRYNMWSPLRARRVGDDGLLHPFVDFEYFGDPKSLNCDRDSQGDVWFADMGVSVVRGKNLENLQSGLLPQKWMGQNIFPLKQDAGLDVDYAWQMPQVEWWIKNGHNG